MLAYGKKGPRIAELLAAGVMTKQEIAAEVGCCVSYVNLKIRPRPLAREESEIRADLAQQLEHIVRKFNESLGDA